MPGCQKLQMTAFTRCGTGCFIAIPYGKSGRQRVKHDNDVTSDARYTVTVELGDDVCLLGVR